MSKKKATRAYHGCSLLTFLEQCWFFIYLSMLLLFYFMSFYPWFYFSTLCFSTSASIFLLTIPCFSTKYPALHLPVGAAKCCDASPTRDTTAHSYNHRWSWNQSVVYIEMLSSTTSNKKSIYKIAFSRAILMDYSFLDKIARQFF